MAVSSVIFNGSTLIDLTNDTVTPETVLKGTTFHASNGNQLIGTYEGNTDIEDGIVCTALYKDLKIKTSVCINAENNAIKDNALTSDINLFSQLPYVDYRYNFLNNVVITFSSKNYSINTNYYSYYNSSNNNYYGNHDYMASLGYPPTPNGCYNSQFIFDINFSINHNNYSTPNNLVLYTNITRWMLKNMYGFSNISFIIGNNVENCIIFHTTNMKSWYCNDIYNCNNLHFTVYGKENMNIFDYSSYGPFQHFSTNDIPYTTNGHNSYYKDYFYNIDSKKTINYYLSNSFGNIYGLASDGVLAFPHNITCYHSCWGNVANFSTYNYWGTTKINFGGEWANFYKYYLWGLNSSYDSYYEISQHFQYGSKFKNLWFDPSSAIINGWTTQNDSSNLWFKNICNNIFNGDTINNIIAPLESFSGFMHNYTSTERRTNFNVNINSSNLKLLGTIFNVCNIANYNININADNLEYCSRIVNGGYGCNNIVITSNKFKGFIRIQPDNYSYNESDIQYYLPYASGIQMGLITYDTVINKVNITLPNNIKYADGLFAECRNFNSLDVIFNQIFTADLESCISAFWNCNNMYFPESQVNLVHCTNLKDVSGLFYGNLKYAPRNIILPENIEKIRYFINANNTNVRNIYISSDKIMPGNYFNMLADRGTSQSYYIALYFKNCNNFMDGKPVNGKQLYWTYNRYGDYYYNTSYKVNVFNNYDFSQIIN